MQHQGCEDRGASLAAGRSLCAVSEGCLDGLEEGEVGAFAVLGFVINAADTTRPGRAELPEYTVGQIIRVHPCARQAGLRGAARLWPGIGDSHVTGIRTRIAR